MPFTNFESRHFSAEEKTAVLAALDTLENALSPKLANLSPEERQQYGSVNEHNKLIINKVKDYHDSQPTLSSSDVDWTEFASDYESRAFLEASIHRLNGLIEGLASAKILHDWDNYQAALTDYDYAKYKAGTNSAGYQTKVNEIAQFFNRSGATSSSKTSNPPEETTN